MLVAGETRQAYQETSMAATKFGSNREMKTSGATRESVWGGQGRADTASTDACRATLPTCRSHIADAYPSVCTLDSKTTTQPMICPPISMGDTVAPITPDRNV